MYPLISHTLILMYPLISHTLIIMYPLISHTLSRRHIACLHSWFSFKKYGLPMTKIWYENSGLHSRIIIHVFEKVYHSFHLSCHCLNLNTQYQNANSPFLSPYILYRRNGEKLFKYQENSSRVIMTLILITSLFD